MPTTINSSFIGNFKLGDNINHSLATLEALYAAMNAAPDYKGSLFRKPITVLNISLIEAVLYDFHNRMRNFVREGVVNVKPEVLVYVRELRKIDELGVYIASARKHDFFDLKDTNFYDCLDELRKLRNRIHIQNTKNHFEPDDSIAFSNDRMVLSQQALEQVMRTMSAKYSRDKRFVADFELPWDTHFPD